MQQAPNISFAQGGKKEAVPRNHLPPKYLSFSSSLHVGCKDFGTYLMRIYIQCK